MTTKPGFLPNFGVNPLPSPLSQTEKDAELNPGLRVIPRELLAPRRSQATTVFTFLPQPWRHPPERPCKQDGAKRGTGMWRQGKSGKGCCFPVLLPNMRKGTGGTRKVPGLQRGKRWGLPNGHKPI